MEALFGPEVWPNIMVYLDDVIIISETLEEHIKWVEYALRRIVDAGLQVNPDKCEFCCLQVFFSGYLLDAEGLRPDPAKVESILRLKLPKGITSLRSFLGAVNWYGRFIEHESGMKVPLAKLTSKKNSWVWELRQQEAFETLKRALTEAPVLARPDFTRMFKI